MKNAVFVAGVALLIVCGSLPAGGWLFPEAVKVCDDPSGDCYFAGLLLGFDDAEVVEVSLPNTGGVFVAAEYEWCGNRWAWRGEPTDLASVQATMTGTWQVKVTWDAGSGLQDSIFSFDVLGVQDSEFTAVPTPVSPKQGDPNVIAQHYQFAWDSNGAEATAYRLSLFATGDDYCYQYSDVPGSMTSWHPGWLGLGEGFFRIGYSRFFPMQHFVHAGGEPIVWDTLAEARIAGFTTSYSVSRTLDFNDDGAITWADFAFMAAHWLETE